MVLFDASFPAALMASLLADASAWSVHVRLAAAWRVSQVCVVALDGCQCDEQAVVRAPERTCGMIECVIHVPSALLHSEVGLQISLSNGVMSNALRVRIGGGL